MSKNTSMKQIKPNGSYTYILFTTQNGNFGRIAGPVFGYEIDAVKQRFFQDEQEVQVLEETVFISLYRERYWKHIEQFWMDKAYVYFYSNRDWIGQVNMDTQTRGFTSNWFTMFEQEVNGERCIQIQFVVNANRFYPPRLLIELQQILPWKLIPKEDYYVSDSNLYTGTRALQRLLAEKCVKKMCFS